MSCSYSDSPFSNKSSHLSLFRWPNFVSLAPVLYILYYLLHDETALQEFIYKEINIKCIIGNTYTSDYTEFFKVILWLDIYKLLFHFLTIIVSIIHFL